MKTIGIIERHIESLGLELKSIWNNSSAVDKHCKDISEDLTDVNYTVFRKIYKRIDRNQSKGSLCGMLIKAQYKKVLSLCIFDV